MKLMRKFLLALIALNIIVAFNFSISLIFAIGILVVGIGYMSFRLKKLLAGG